MTYNSKNLCGVKINLNNFNFNKPPFVVFSREISQRFVGTKILVSLTRPLITFFFVLFFTSPLSANAESTDLEKTLEKAKQGDAEAQYYVGYEYYKGSLGWKNFKETVKWFRLSANQGYEHSQLFLGAIYKQGVDGFPQDYKEADKWLRAAAIQGNVDAQMHLGGMYEEGGHGISQDYKEAAQWYRRAANQGNKYAQTKLGAFYYNGNGVLHDYKESAKWSRLAADQGYGLAQLNLGILYDNGYGVLQDHKEAAKWFRLAADQGYGQAQFNLGVLYYNGNGVLKSNTKAYSWLSIAKYNGQEASRLLETIRSEMTTSDINIAQALSKRCLESKYRECD